MNTGTTDPLHVPQNITDKIRHIKANRVLIDNIVKDIEGLNPCRETAVAKTKLQEARMWLGQALGEINARYPGTNPHPYPNGNNPASDKIDPPKP